MKHTRKSKVLSLLLVLAMVFSMLPGTAFAADAVTYTQLTSINDLTKGGEAILIAAYTNENTTSYYALDTTISNKIAATPVSTASNVSALPVWSISASGSGISLHNGNQYLAYSSSTDFTSSDSPSTWLVEEGTATNSFCLYAESTATASSARYVAFQWNKGNYRFGAYAGSNKGGSGYSFDLMIYVKDAGTVEPPTEIVAAPAAFPAPSEVESGTQVTFSCETEGAKIYYHTGDDKVAEYTDPITVSEATTFSVYAEKDEIRSETVTFTYTIKTADPAPNDPVLPFANGDQVVIYAPAYSKALSATKTSNYNAGVDITVTDSVMSGFDETEIWTVSVNEDGSVSFANGGQNLGMADDYSSMNLGAVHDSWELTDLGDGLYNVKNTGRGNYMEWYAQYSNWSTYNSTSAATDAQFQLAFYAVPEDYEPPTDPEPSEPENPTVSYADKMAAAPNDGDTILIYNPANTAAMGSAPSDKKMAGVTANTVKGKLPIAEGMAQLLVSIDESGNYIFTVDGKYLTSAGTGNGISLSDELTDCGKWILETATDGTWYIKNVGANYNGNYNQAMEYYSGFTTYGLKETAVYQMELYLVEAARQNGIITDLTALRDGDTVVIFNPANMMALSTAYSGYYNSGTAVIGTDGKLSGYTAADIWTVGINADGTYTFSTAEGKKLSMGAEHGSMPLDDVNTAWTVTPAATEDCFYIKNVARKNYIEWYADKNNWSSYYKISDETLFAQQIYLVVDAVEEPGSSQPGTDEQVVIFNLSAQGVLAGESDTQSIRNAAAEIVDGAAVPANGGVVFTVSQNGDYYRFYNETYGYLCSNGTGNNAFYSAEASEDADWILLDGKSGGFNMESRTAKYNEKYSQYLEYYADSYKTYSMYNVTDYDIYEFFFYPVADTVSLTGGIVNAPVVVFGNVYPAYVGMDYTYSFSVDSVFGVETLKVAASVGNTYFELEPVEETGIYTVCLTAEQIQALYDASAETEVRGIFSMSVSGEDVKGVEFSNGSAIDIKDEPGIGAVTPAPGTETGEDLAPVISAEITNAGEEPEITMTVNGVEVETVRENGTVSYDPTEDLPEGRTTVILTVQRSDGKEVSKTWSFIVGKAQYQLYFGQLHSHTTYSDGSGSLESALEYIAALPESANVDFVAFTDHSNYFDTTEAANPEGALYDMTLATAASQKLWTAYKQAIADFNTSQSDVIAIGGFEMTWSGGPGHINTFNTEGIVSRNNGTLNNKTADAGMKAYYSLLSQPEGMDSINQFNHPGSTFGTFSDFAYWDPVIDTRIQLVEVGNGEGQIGAGGYFPSYEYYTMALDKGWHVAPTNNQDNHKGKWGNANDARDVILTDDFSEEGIYSAIQAMRMYATEDKNLEIGYSVNGQLLGSSITEVPEQLNFEVTVYDPDKSDSISKVELIVNSGKVAHTWDDPADLADGALSVTLDPTYSYYYVRVTEGDGDLAVTAPVWVGESLKLGISSVKTATSTPVTNEALTIKTTLFNSEASDASVKTLVYSVGDAVIGTDTTGYTVPASGNLTVDFIYTPTAAKLTTVTVTAIVEQDGTEYEFTMDIELDVQDANKLVYIGIDASHFNEYVAGNYKDSMGNFSTLAAKFGVRAVQLNSSEALIAACSNEKYKALVLTAPSRRNGSALRDPYATYSDDEIAALKAFNAAGGTVILTGWGDYYESYSEFPAEDHMAAQQNKVLAALGSSLRIADDETKDDTHNGSQAQRLYLSVYDFDNFLLDGVAYDADNPHDNMYTELYSQYGGASIYVVDAQGVPTASVPTTVTPAVYGFETTYSADDDSDGFAGLKVTQKYTVGESEHLMVLATEQIGEQGLIVVAGAAFLSNFEVQATIEDSGAEKNYSNYKICENLLAYINPVAVTPIEEVHAQTEVGYKYTIEGTVTSNASGYDKDTAFFDCIYVQDETGGICCFPVAGNYKIGDKVRITGTTEFYQGEPELQVTSIEVIGSSEEIEPTAVTAAEINDRSAEGKLITLSGRVTSFELANGLVQTIMIEDAAGDTARVFIDGYITTAEDVKDLEVGCGITITGLASYDDTFNAPTGPFPRIRVRDRADVVCTEHIHDFTETEVKPTCVAEGYTEYLCQCGYSYRDSFIRATGHTTASVVTAPTHNAMGYTVTACENCDYSFVHSFTDALEHTFTKKVTKQATCTAEGEWTFTCECGVSYTQIIPVTGHSCVKTVVDPECEKFGYTVYQCSGCDYNYLADPTEPTGHTYTGKYVGGGLIQYTCPCGHTYTDLHDCPSAAYGDLDPEMWYHEATDFVLTQGIMIGTAEETFTPNGELTRGQIVTILYRLAGEPEVDEAAPFTDVKETAYYAKAVAWGYTTGIVKGVSDDAFAPDQVVARQQMAAFLYRYAGSPAATADAAKGFADSADISDYALDAMNWIVSAGILNGTSETTLAPKDATTRVQAAAFVYRYLIAA